MKKIVFRVLAGLAVLVALAAGVQQVLLKPQPSPRLRGDPRPPRLTFLQRIGWQRVDPAGPGLGPPIDGVIQAVRLSDKLAVISVGKDQKVEEGFEFTVYRGDKFIGTVRVTKVYDNLAGARILSTNEAESIQVGDQASTQI